jgi:hypothetical protein
MGEEPRRGQSKGQVALTSSIGVSFECHALYVNAQYVSDANPL